MVQAQALDVDNETLETFLSGLSFFFMFAIIGFEFIVIWEYKTVKTLLIIPDNVSLEFCSGSRIQASKPFARVDFF